MRSFFKIITIICLCCTLVTLSACRSSAWNYAPPPSPTASGAMIGIASGAAIGSVAGGGFMAPVGAAVGGIIGGAWGNIIQAHQGLIERLLYNGVQVI